MPPTDPPSMDMICGNAEVIEQVLLGPDHIPDGDHGEVKPVGFARFRIDG